MDLLSVNQTETAVFFPPCPHPTVSVIVVNYNGRSYLDACLSSVLATSSSDVELIVVDNNSTDGSAEHVAHRFPDVRLLQRAVNDGYGAGNNIAADIANGEYLVILNPDTVVTPGWWELLVNALEQQPQAGMATPKILMLNEPNQINTAGNDVHLTGLTMCRGMGQPAESLTETAVVSAISGAAFAIRRDLFLELGGFDPAYFLYMEDTDLSLRVQLAGYSCLVVPESIVYHDYVLHFGAQKTYHQERNRYLMLLKIWRWRTLLLLLPALMLAELITWAFVLLQDRTRWTNKLKAYAAIWRERSTVLACRKQAQSQRRISDRELIQKLPYRLAFEQTGNGIAAKAAHLLFDPLFNLTHLILRTTVRW
ncbi:MAG: glycosyltransferase family 2 protein [Chloroflexi bacterium]|nr:glycosyltransferase family 2 protein [Chloroflexota bacterium]